MASNDPFFHQSAERKMLEHVSALLADSRFVIDTTSGRKSVAGLLRNVSRNDHATDVKRLMTELNVPDRTLEQQMPVGERLDISLGVKKLFILTKTIGHLRVVCTSPSRQLIKREAVHPMSSGDVEKLLRSLPPPISKVPLTTIVMSTSGFDIDTRAIADRTAERITILVEPNDAGGWTVHGPPETKALNDLLDPEEGDDKKQRVTDAIGEMQYDLLNGSISADKIAARTKLPLQLVEAEVKTFAKRNSGLTAKRVEGRMLLFREGSSPVVSASGGSGSIASALGEVGGTGMAMVDKIRSLFSRKGELEKKVAFLSERRAALSQQRDRSYEEIGMLEQKDEQLRDEFGKARAPLTKRRITSQLVQLRKDIERRQQMLTVLNQQVNVVSTHLHNLELTKQGETAKLPDSEEIANDAAAVEEMLAQLQADSEIADSVSGITGTSMTAGMSDEEQALFEELERESGGGAPGKSAMKTTALQSTIGKDVDAVNEPARRDEPSTQSRQRANPEAG